MDGTPHGDNQRTTRKVLVLGGTGFIGRHVVAALLQSGCAVIVGSRHPERIARRIPELVGHCESRCARFERMLEPQAWSDALSGVECVINCVGILRQRGRETYRRVHHLAPAALAESCRLRSVRIVHVSALGLQPDARSRFLRSKLDGERALRASGADWTIVRPSLLDGDGGYGAKWLRRVARWRWHVLPADATGRIAALHVADLGEALARIVLVPADSPIGDDARIRELGGADRQTLDEYLASLHRQYSDKPARCIHVPSVLARLCSHLCDVLHITPFSFGHWELLRRDNCPRINHLPELLGRTPRSLGPSPLANNQAPIGTVCA